MSKITWTIETPEGTVNWSTAEIPEAKFALFLDWAWDSYRPIENDAPAPDTPANRAQSVRTACQNNWREWRYSILVDRRKVAARNAKDAVEDIED